MYSLGYIWPFVQRPSAGRAFGEEVEETKPEKFNPNKFISDEDTLIAQQRAALIGEGVRIGMREGLSLAAKFGLALGLGIAGLAIGGSAVAAIVQRTRGQSSG